MRILSAVAGSATPPICSSLSSSTGKEKRRERKEEVVSFKIKELKSFAAPFMAASFLALSPLCCPPESLAETSAEIQRGATLFNKSCIGCHDAGGNIIQPGATLFAKDLERNGVDTEDEIYKITYFGKGRMPGFGEKCSPRGQCTFGARLQDEEIKLLAQFVKSQADQGWPTIAE